MKKLLWIKLLFIGVTLLATSCVTTQPLDLTTLEDNNFNLKKIVFMINEDTDVDSKGEDFVKLKFPELLEEIGKGLYEKHGVTIDYSDFIDQVQDGSVVIEKEVEDYGFIVHYYTWKNDKDFDQEVKITLPFAVKEDNTITAMTKLLKVNPVDPTTKLKKSVDINLEFVEN